MTSKESAERVVVEVEPGRYAVLNAPYVVDSHYTPGRGILSVAGRKRLNEYVGKPHIVVQGMLGVAEDELQRSIDTVVKGIEADLASHKGWSPPKLETVAAKIKQIRGVSVVSVERPSTSN